MNNKDIILLVLILAVLYLLIMDLKRKKEKFEFKLSVPNNISNNFSGRETFSGDSPAPIKTKSASETTSASTNDNIPIEAIRHLVKTMFNDELNERDITLPKEQIGITESIKNLGLIAKKLNEDKVTKIPHTLQVSGLVINSDDYKNKYKLDVINDKLVISKIDDYGRPVLSNSNVVIYGTNEILKDNIIRGKVKGNIELYDSDILVKGGNIKLMRNDDKKVGKIITEGEICLVNKDTTDPRYTTPIKWYKTVPVERKAKENCKAVFFRTEGTGSIISVYKNTGMTDKKIDLEIPEEIKYGEHTFKGYKIKIKYNDYLLNPFNSEVTNNTPINEESEPKSKLSIYFKMEKEIGINSRSSLILMPFETSYYIIYINKNNDFYILSSTDKTIIDKHPVESNYILPIFNKIENMDELYKIGLKVNLEKSKDNKGIGLYKMYIKSYGSKIYLEVDSNDVPLKTNIKPEYTGGYIAGRNDGQIDINYHSERSKLKWVNINQSFSINSTINNSLVFRSGYDDSKYVKLGLTTRSDNKDPGKLVFELQSQNTNKDNTWIPMIAIAHKQSKDKHSADATWIHNP